MALGVGAEPRFGAGMAGLGQGLQDGVGIIDGRRHEHVGLGAREAEHEALVAGALVLVAGGVHALGDVRRLGMHMDVDLGVPPVKALLFVTNVLDGGAGDVFQVRVGDGVRPPHLAGEHDEVGGAQGLDGDARMGVGGEVGIDDGVGYAVANLVGMSLGNGLACEQVIGLRHGLPLGSRCIDHDGPGASTRASPIKVGGRHPKPT